MTELESSIVNYFRAENPQLLRSHDINLDSRFREDIGLDSLDLVDLRFKVQMIWGIKVPMEDFRKMTCINDITEYITAALSAQKEN